jgi:hypothetical protein
MVLPSRQSAKLFLQSSEFGLLHSQPPPPFVWGGGANSLAGEGVGESHFRRGDIHWYSRYICSLCLVGRAGCRGGEAELQGVGGEGRRRHLLHTGSPRHPHPLTGNNVRCNVRLQE